MKAVVLFSSRFIALEMLLRLILTTFVPSFALSVVPKVRVAWFVLSI
jgi:hypothetical protein